MQAAERRAAILREAVKLFAERGFRGTTTRDLAAACGVSEPVLYEHFATKRELYTAIIEAKGEEGFARFQALVGPYLETDDDRRFFEGLGQLILEFYEDHPEHGRLLMFSALEGHETAGFTYSQHREAIHAMVVRYIERRIQAGAFRPVDPGLAARAFVGMLAHYGWTSAVFRCGIPGLGRKELIAGMVGVFLDGVRVPSPQPEAGTSTKTAGAANRNSKRSGKHR